MGLPIGRRPCQFVLPFLAEVSLLGPSGFLARAANNVILPYYSWLKVEWMTVGRKGGGGWHSLVAAPLRVRSRVRRERTERANSAGFPDSIRMCVFSFFFEDLRKSPKASESVHRSRIHVILELEVHNPLSRVKNTIEFVGKMSQEKSPNPP